MPQPFTLTPSPQQNMEAFNMPTSLITAPPPVQPSAPAVVTSKIANDQIGAFNQTMTQANQAMASKQQQNTVQQQAQSQQQAQAQQGQQLISSEDANRKALQDMQKSVSDVKSALSTGQAGVTTDAEHQKSAWELNHPGQIYPGAATTSATPLNATDQAIQDNNKAQEQAFNTYNQQMQQFQSGTFPYTPSQQAEIDSLKSSYRQAIDAQQQYNQHYEQGITKLGLVTGISRYSPAQNMGQIQRAVSDGISRVRKIEDGMASAVAQMENGFQQNNFKLVDAAYTKYSDFLQERSKTLQETKKVAQEHADKIMESQQKLKDAMFDLSQPISMAGKAVQDYVHDSLVKYPGIMSTFAEMGGTPEDFENLNAGQIAQLIKASPEYKLEQQKEQSSAFGSGDVGEYQRALSAGLIPAGTSFTSFKNIGKEGSGGGFPGGSSGLGEQVDAYARQYASTGTVPVIPEAERKNGVTLAAIQQAARALPKPAGMIYDAATGIKPSQIGQAFSDGLIALRRASEQANELKDLRRKVMAGGKPQETAQARAQYNSTRTQMLADLLLAKSGAAVSEQELARWNSLFPTTSIFNRQPETKIDQFINESRKTLDTKLNSNNLKMAGYNDVSAEQFDE